MATTSTQPRYARRSTRAHRDEPADDPLYTLDVWDEGEVPPEPVDPNELARHHVTAMLVAHEGRRWLPEVLAALDRLDRRPDLITAIDTGSKDNTRQLLAEALGDAAVLRVNRTTGFGAAISKALTVADARMAAALAATEGERVQWIWLLHDDSAPEPTTLTRLLECAVRNPDAAVIGPKVRGWADSRQLLEVGLTITTGGRRYTGLERRELDQGQQDETRSVLAVGSAGMLVRRDVWDSLGGFDPQLSLFRDDIDFGWRANLAGHRVVVCPEAVMHHAEASAHGRRRIGTTRQRPHLVDRRNALHVVLVNCSLRRLPLSLVQVTLGSVLRAVGFLIGKLPMTALEELAALGAVLVRPDRLIRARRDRRELRHRTPEELRHLFPPRGHQVRYAADTLLSVLSGTGAGQDLTVAKRRATGSDVDDDHPDTDTVHHLRSVVGRPSVALSVCLVIVALLAERSLLFGGRLMGGALLPAQDNVAALWDTYTTSWHTVGLGSPTAAPPYLALLALLGILPAGHVPLAVDVLMLLSVPLAGLAAYAGLRRLVTSPGLRVWGASVYGLLPATTGAIAAGRLGTCVAIVTTPLLCVAVHRMLGTPTSPGPLRSAWVAALLLAVTAAFVPLAWVAAVVLSGVAVAVGVRGRAALIRLAIVLLVPPLLLIPWTFEVVRTPLLLFTEAGAPGPGLSDPQLPAWAVAVGHPGGLGSAPGWLFAGLVLAGVAGVLRPDTRRVALVGATVAVTGLVLGLAVSRTPITGPTLDAPVAGWPGYATVLVVLGVLAAAVAGAQNVHRRLATAGFSWQQPAALATAVIAVMVPVVAAVWWVWRGADDPLTRRESSILPAYVVRQNTSPAHPRTLVISRDGSELVTYAVLRDGGPQLGDAETGPTRDVSRVTDRVVGDLVSGRGSHDVTALTDLAVAHVYLPPPADNALVTMLDSVPGLSRASAPEGAAMWKVDADVSRLRIVNPDGTFVAVPSDAVGARVPLPDGPDGRRLVLAEAADSGWQATLMGRPLDPITVDGWAQGFALPRGAGQLELTHRDDTRTRLLWLQGVLATLVLIVALPSARRRAVDGDENDDSEIDLAPPPTLEPMPDDTQRRHRGRRRKSAPAPFGSRHREGNGVSAQEWLSVPETDVLDPPPQPEVVLDPPPEVEEQETATLGPPPVVVPLDEGTAYRPRRAGRRIDEETNR
jgi:GT2 family glycosyltransferase